jgi:TP901 family phage tail tape measure protein
LAKTLELGVVLGATDMLSPVFSKASTNLNKFQGKVKALGASMTKLGAVSLGLGASLAIPLGKALTSYQDLAAAQGEIASLGISDSGIKAITKASMEFSNQFAGTTAPEFVKASYDIKSGISSLSDTAVGQFTKLAAMTGAATKSSTGEMTSLFASGFGIYRQQFENFGATTIGGWNKLSAEEKDVKFGEYFSAGISSAVQAFKTDGANMSAAISNLGAAATTANVPFNEQLSILGMLQKTMSGSEAATKYRAFLSSATGASDKLGLSFMDSNNQLLSMPEIISQIKDKYGETIDAVEAAELKKAFGTEEAVALVTQLYDKTDVLTDSMYSLGDSLKQGTVLTEDMAKKMNKGREFEVLGQKMGNLSSLIGQTFAPAALMVGNVIGDTVLKVQVWMKDNEKLAGTIGTVLAGVAGLLTVLGTVAITVGAVTMAIPALTTAFAVLSGGIGFLGTTIGFVGKMFLMNPIGLAVTAIATAAYLIYDNWQPISEFFINLWGGVTLAADSFFNWISSKFDWFGKSVSKLKNIGSSIAGFFGFGGDDQKENTKKATASKSVSIAQPRMNYATPNISSPASQKNQNITQHIKVNVQNPSSNVEVETAIRNAMANGGADRGLSDDL